MANPTADYLGPQGSQSSLTPVERGFFGDGGDTHSVAWKVVAPVQRPEELLLQIRRRIEKRILLKTRRMFFSKSLTLELLGKRRSSVD